MTLVGQTLFQVILFSLLTPLVVFALAIDLAYMTIGNR